MKKVGLTGSIGMGKSTIANMFATQGIPVFDSDASVHELYSDKKIIDQITNYFPDCYDSENKLIDRAKLALIIFGNNSSLEQGTEAKNNKQRLESIIHPFVKEEQRRFLMQHRSSNKKMILFDIPLLYETQAEKDLDYVIVVTAPFFIQKQRVLARDGMTIDKFNKILKSQIPDNEKVRMADFVIQTSENRATIYKNIEKIIKQIN